MPADTSLLNEVHVFKLLDPDELELLAAQLDEVHFAAGQQIFSRGDPGDAIYVVNTGEVEISIADSTGERIVFEKVQPGDFFGELSLFDGEPRSSDAIATQDTHALRVDRHDLEILFHSHPDAAMDFLTVMGRRLREADRMLQYRPVISPNEAIEEQITTVQRIADFLAAFSGTITFLPVHLGWFIAWVIFNLPAHPALRPFDPFPFGLLTMIVSLEAIFLSCFVLISQSRQAAKDRIRSDVEYAANIKAGLEVSQLHVKVDHLYDQLMGQLAALNRKTN
ncbi:MAG: DUF1003 domain-containing protein [Chloroflexi bacterium]|nr:DUF1003 domain-containing protein [Chloroflexota bacterium]